MTPEQTAVKTHGSLFTGIGGFDLAAELAGYKTMFQVEIDPFCNRVLNKRFPGVPKYLDVRSFDGLRYRGMIDILSGGFPCQNISLAASRDRVGVDGEKSGLWREQLRIAKEINPNYIILENSATINKKGFATILDAYSDLGYDAEWYRLEPKQFGQPQKRRQRTYVILYTTSIGDRLQERQVLTGWDEPQYTAWRGSEDRIYGVADGVPDRVDRHRALGNAIDPFIALAIFKAISNQPQDTMTL